VKKQQQTTSRFAFIRETLSPPVFLYIPTQLGKRFYILKNLGKRTIYYVYLVVRTLCIWI